MKTAIILHGMPSREEALDPATAQQSRQHWLPWVQQELTIRHGIVAQVPELPEAWNPDYQKWRAVFEQLTVDQDTVLIGHSCGAGFLVRWLSEHPVMVGKVVLVAPWLDPEHELTTGFFDFSIDSALAGRTQGVTIFVSRDDDKQIQASVQMLQEKIKAVTTKEFVDKGHFIFDDMGTNEFPELVAFVVKD